MAPKKKRLEDRPSKCNDILDDYRKPEIFFNIPATNTKKKKCAFNELRPKPGIYVDYNISQTDYKMDAGCTKIHLQQTTATYQRPPPGIDIVVHQKPKSRIRYGHGHAPFYEFWDETVRRKADEEQEFYRKRLEELVRQNKKHSKSQHKHTHDIAVERAGPEWFQELSPKQLRTVDKLKDCLIKDLLNNTIINTQENIATLGLVLRPNHRHIAMALKNCWGCPIEFLLILYQLINPKRTSYSINDRLLLSAVVHLSIVDTLKELHVRIPSPPPQEKPPQQPLPKKEKPKTYDSPYLVPFTFQPEPRKFTGVYKNKHVQHPESYYFSYIPQLREEQKALNAYYAELVEKGEKNKYYELEDNTSVSSSELTKTKREIFFELQTAQQVYDNLTNLEHPPRLLRPSIYAPCNPEFQKANSKERVSIAIELTVTTELDMFAEPTKKKCECLVKFKNSKNPQAETTDKLIIQIDKNVPNTYEEMKLADYITKFDVMRELDKLPKCKCMTCACSGSVEKGECNCAERNALKGQLEDFRRRERLVNKMDRSKEKYIIGGVVRRPSGKFIFIINGIQPPLQKDCFCEHFEELRRKNEEIISRREAIKSLSSLPNRFIIGGVFVRRDGTTAFIISGVIDGQTTPLVSCAERAEKIRQFQEMRYRQQMVKKLINHPDKFINGGVVIQRDGKPVFLLNGLKPVLPCVCDKEKLMRELQMEKWRQENLTDLFGLPDKYIIGGVVNRPNEKPVFMINGIQPTTELCKCLDRIDQIQHYKDVVLRRQLIAQFRKHADKYIIGGVVHRGDEPPVYIINGVKQPSKDLDPLEKFREIRIRQQAANEFVERPGNFMVGGVVIGPRSKPIFIINGTFKPTEASTECLTRLEKINRYRSIKLRQQALAEFKTLPDKYVITGVTCKPNQKPIFILSGVKTDRSRLFSRKGYILYALRFPDINIPKPPPTDSNLPFLCPLYERYEQIMNYKSIRLRQKYIKEYLSLPYSYLIAGVVNRPNGEPVFIISGVLPHSRKCRHLRNPQHTCGKENAALKIECIGDQCNESATEQTKTTRVKKVMVCGKMGDVEQKHTVMMKKPKQQIVSPKKEVFVPEEPKQRVRESEEEPEKLVCVTQKSSTECVCKEEMQKLLDATKILTPCDCIDDYLEQVEKYESFKVRRKAVDELKSMGQKYIIGGVCIRDGQPVFNFLGTEPKVTCPCKERMEEEREKQKLIENIPTLPRRPNKFILSGLRDTDEGTKFVISGVKAAEDCNCMKLYDVFKEKHKPCLELFEKYMDKVKSDVEEYLSEVDECACYDDYEKDDCVCDEEDKKEVECEKEETKDIDKEVGQTDDNKGDQEDSKCKDCCPPKKVETDEVENEKDNKCRVCCPPKVEIKETDDSSSDEEDLSMTTKCTLTLDIEDKSKCKCDDKPKYPLKRIIIEDKIPCDIKKQKEIIKMALEMMAEDGFPLAKLPNAYKLPIFQLWMQKRCKKFWTQEDRIKYCKYSKQQWKHLDICQRSVSLHHLRLDITAQQGREYTWKNASTVRDMVKKKISFFNRKMCQNSIDDGREFFPTLFTYEFPTPTFRDCFFAYTPSKEEDVIYFRPWNSFEYKKQRHVCS